MMRRTAFHIDFSICLWVLLFALAVSGRYAEAQRLAVSPGFATPVIGNGNTASVPGYSGPAGSYSSSSTTGSTLDSAGNLYFYDGALHVIPAANASIPSLSNPNQPNYVASPQANHVYQVAGNGTNTPSINCTGTTAIGDGCYATLAGINFSADIAVDAKGDIFIADSYNSEIRVVYAGGDIPNLPANPEVGRIYALAGNGTSGTIGDGGPALSAEITEPRGPYVDASGNLYFADEGSNAVRVLYSGKGSVVNLPSNAKAGSLYTIVGILGAQPCANNNATSNPCGDSYPASQATMSYPQAVVLDASGNLYISDTADDRIRAVYASGSLPGISSPLVGNIYTIAGNGFGYGGPLAEGRAATLASLTPVGIAVGSDGTVYFADSAQSLVRRIDAAGIITTAMGSVAANSPIVCAVATTPAGDGCASNQVILNRPYNVNVDSAGNLYVVDSQGLIHKSDVSTTSLNFTESVGIAASQNTYLYNVSPQTLHLSGLGVTGNFSQVPSGGSNDCSSSTALAAAASCTLNISYGALAVGNDLGTLIVSSDSTSTPSGKNTIQLTGSATQDTTTIGLIISTVLANVGQQITMTATVTGQPGTTLLPTGTVSFVSGTTTLGTAPVGSNGVATLTTASIAAGIYSVVASYAGDVNFMSNSTFTHSLQVSSTPVPIVTLTASSAAATPGGGVTVNVTVAPFSGSKTPTGTVTFQDGSIALGSATLDGSGNASFSSSTLPAGSNTLYASYAGDGIYTSALSNGVAVNVTKAPQAQLVPGIITTPVAGLLANSIAVDTNGNVFFGNNVLASGKGSIPGVPAPVAGTSYTLIQQITCPNSTYPCNVPGPAANAGIGNGLMVVLDAERNLYIFSDVGRYFRLDAKTDYVTEITPAPVAATSTSPASSPPLSNFIPSFFIDHGGNLYLADLGNLVVLRVDAISGVMTVVAGTPGVPCLTAPCGDGGPATSALLGSPTSLYVDAAGDLFMTDSNAIRKVDGKTGIITTVAGTLNASQCTPYNSVNCGDAGPATQAFFSNPKGLIGDAGGNLYFADASAIRRIDTQGNIATIAGTVISGQPASGDNGLATSASLYQPSQPAFDGQGNLYIAGAVLRKVTAGTTAFTFQAADAGPSGTKPLTLTNTSNSPLHVTGLSFASGFVQQSVGASDCTGMDTLAPGSFCTIGVAFFPVASGSETGSLNIADDSSNAVGGQNVISLSGVSATGASQTLTFAPLPDVTYGTAPIALKVTASSADPEHNPVSFSVAGPASISGSVLTVTGAGKVTVTAYQVGGNGYEPATSVSQSFNVAQVGLTVTATSFSCTYGQVAQCLQSNPLAYTITGFVNGDTQSVIGGSATLVTTASESSGATGSYPITFATSALSSNNYTFTYVPGALNITGGTVQSITFIPLSGATYGSAPITLAATSSSGLPVSYTAVGPGVVSGSLLSITGAGVVTVIAQQSGNAAYAAATPVSQSLIVAKAVLTVTANNQTIAQGTALGNFSAAIVGYVNGDPSSVVTGAPAFTTNANPASPLGPQTLYISQGTLASSNYSFIFVTGTVTVGIGTTQTIVFTPIPALTYGIGPVSLQASASSGLSVRFTVSGPARITGSTLNVTGAGVVVVTASQTGGGSYGAAIPVAQSISVTPAVLTLTANNATRLTSVANPPFAVTIAGYVNGDATSVVGGTPFLTTTATPGSAAGTYPINVAQGSLTAVNYSFVPLPGTLTVTSGGPAPDYSITATPQVLTMLPGQTRQTTLILTPINYFLGSVSLSCGTLPANMSCVFTPAAFNVDGTGTPVSVTLTINTNSGSPIVGALSPVDQKQIFPATIFFLPGGLSALWLAFHRKHLSKDVRLRQWMMLFLLFTGLAGITACGSSNASSNNPRFVAAGTSTVAVTAAGTSTNLAAPGSHSINITVTVEGPQ